MQALTNAEDVDGYRDHCVRLLQIPNSLVKQYERENFPNDMQTKCYVRCVFNELGLLNETTFNVERFVLLLGDSNISDGENFIRSKVVKCTRKHAQTTDACEVAYRSFICFRKENLVESL